MPVDRSSATMIVLYRLFDLATGPTMTMDPAIVRVSLLSSTVHSICHYHNYHSSQLLLGTGLVRSDWNSNLILTEPELLSQVEFETKLNLEW